jgi:nucleoside-diphosphate-sugar epimerase
MLKKVAMNKPSSIGIIGCGWLGTALALNLLKNKTSVLATVTRDERVTALMKQNIKTKILVLPSAVESLSRHLVFSQQKLVICFPPQLKKGQQDYPEKISQIVAAAEKQGVKEIVLISTTSIYNGLSGKVSEQTPLNMSANKVDILNDAEQKLLNFSGKASIIRFAGLIGPDRHPGRFLSAKPYFANPKGVINLIHQQDAVGIIVALLKQKKSYSDEAHQATTLEIYNGASATHCSRKHFYQAAATAMGLPKPLFKDHELKDDESAVLSKEICSDKVRDVLHYQFIFDDLLAWLEHSH